MSFTSPGLLWTVALIPLLGIGYALLERRRRSAVEAFAAPAMRPNVAPAAPGWRRHLPVALLLGGMLALALAVARPRAEASVPRERATLVFALDASRSMEAADVAPSRLEAARRAALTFIGELPDRFQVGVVSFARTAQVLSHPTADRVALRRAFAAIETAPGTSIGDGLTEALGLRPPAPPGGRPAPLVVVLLSDGNNTGGQVRPRAAAEAARAERVRVFSISFGRASADPSGGLSARPPNAAALSALAETTGGRFYSAPTGEALKEALRILGSDVAYVRATREVTAAFVGAGLVLLVSAGGLSALWFNRLP